VSSKNKKISCFVDETGTAGNADFSLGLVFVKSAEGAKVDKVFSDLLPEGFNEFHANAHDPRFVQSIISNFNGQTAETSVMLFNYHKTFPEVECRETVYARCLIEAIKASAKKFRRTHNMGQQINNIDVLIDANAQNTGEVFTSLIDTARRTDGLFQAVNRVTPLDSSVSRLIQLADGVAYIRHLRDRGDVRTEQISREFGITII